MPGMLFDAALTAWATLGLAVLALVTAIFAFLAWKGQAAQIETLRAQAADQKKLTDEQVPVLRGQAVELEASRQEREREAQERREAYVSRVFVVDDLNLTDRQKEPDSTEYEPVVYSVVHLHNAGELPIYNITFVWRAYDRMTQMEALEMPLMPGERTSARWEIPLDVESGKVSAVAFVTDANQNGWRIRPVGRHDPLGPGEWPPSVW
jgi:hypothetical protein